MSKKKLDMSVEMEKSETSVKSKNCSLVFKPKTPPTES